MKRRYLLFGCLTVAVLATAVAIRASRDGVAVSFQIHSTTNDATGHSLVVLSATKHRAAAVVPDSVAHRVDGAWVWQPMPTNQIAELDALMGKVGQPVTSSVRFPDSSPWRFRFEVVEPKTGIAGLMERLRHPTGFYRKGGVLNVLSGTKPSRYTGRSYYVESEEIR